jgi:hypothetical protein
MGLSIRWRIETAADRQQLGDRRALLTTEHRQPLVRSHQRLGVLIGIFRERFFVHREPWQSGRYRDGALKLGIVPIAARFARPLENGRNR